MILDSGFESRNSIVTYSFACGILCWGKDDTATPLSSAKKIHSLIKDSRLEIYEGDHFSFVKNAKDISAKIEETFLETLAH